MTGYTGWYAVSPTVVNSSGTEATDNSILYWDADTNTIRGDGEITINPTQHQILLYGGTAEYPALSFSGDSDTGIYSGGGGLTKFSANGTEVLRTSRSGLYIPLDTYGCIYFGTTPDLYLYREAANTLGQRNDLTGQVYRLYHWYSGSGSNYERFAIDFAGYYCSIGTQAGGAYKLRPLIINDDVETIAPKDLANIKSAPANEGGRSKDQNVTNIIGSLAVTGAMAADTVRCRRLFNLEGTPYAGCHAAGGASIGWSQASAVQNQWYEITSANIHSELHNRIDFDASTGTLTVQNNLASGIYLIGYAISTATNSTSKNVQTGISINGTVKEAGLQSQTLPAGSVERPMSSRAILDLPAEATIRLAIRTTSTGSPTLYCYQYELTAHKIAG